MEIVDSKKIAIGIVISILFILVAGFVGTITHLFILIYLPPILAGYNAGWELKKSGSTDMKQAGIHGFIVAFVGIIFLYILLSSPIRPIVYLFFSSIFRNGMVSNILIYSILGIISGIIGMKK